MKFEVNNIDSSTWNSITASPIDFDAHPPVSEFRYNWADNPSNVDRTAIACALLYAPWMAGRQDYLRPFSALSAQRIVEWFQADGIWASPTPVRAGGLPIPRGAHRMLLGSNAHDDGNVGLHMQSVTPDAGSGVAGRNVAIASNLGTLRAFAPQPLDRMHMQLGLAVLVSESLHVNELVYPELADAYPDAFNRTRRLLECVSLGLSRA